MPDQIILDLGDYGNILVEAARSAEEVPAESVGIVPASRIGDAAKKAGQQITAKAEEVFKLPLSGLGKCFMAALPDPMASEQWQLDEFSAEFEIGLEAQLGSNVGVVVMVVPNGGFKCTYTWKRKAEEAAAEPD